MLKAENRGGISHFQVKIFHDSGQTWTEGWYKPKCDWIEASKEAFRDTVDSFDGDFIHLRTKHSVLKLQCALEKLN